MASITTFAALVIAEAPAHAQLHWDASAQVGVMRRVLTDRRPGGDDASFGPVGQLSGHIALLPLVRLGAYVGHDVSPMAGESSARDLTWGGLRVKLMSPWPRGTLRLWLFAGFGYAGVYARSTSVPPRVVHGAGGGFFDVPFGIGASYKFHKPWELCGELGMRTGFGHRGSAYEAPGPGIENAGMPAGNASAAGIDRFALGLTIGVLVDL